MLKKIIVFVFLVGCIGAGIGFYFYFKPVKSYENEKPDIIVDALKLIKDFQEDEKTANTRYLNKLVEVRGNVSDVSQDEKGLTNINVSVDGEIAMVTCGMDSTVHADFSSIKSGQPIKLKGLCSGMLMDIILVKCVLAK